MPKETKTGEADLLPKGILELIEEAKAVPVDTVNLQAMLDNPEPDELVLCTAPELAQKFFVLSKRYAKAASLMGIEAEHEGDPSQRNILGRRAAHLKDTAKLFKDLFWNEVYASMPQGTRDKIDGMAVRSGFRIVGVTGNPLERFIKDLKRQMDADQSFGEDVGHA